MNLQILIPLDDLTPENGATSVRPYTQVVAEYPTNVEEYRSELRNMYLFYKTLATFKGPDHVNVN